jgi:TP901 family phage tail tape measure protein
VGYQGNITITATDRTKAAVASAATNIESLNKQLKAQQAQLASLGATTPGGSSGGLAPWIRKNQLALRMFGHDAQMVGQTFFRWLTVPMGVAGVVAAKMAYDFNKSMTKVQALTRTSATQMEVYTKRVLELSKATGVMPKEVAEGLYFIASSGYKGAIALDILTQSTQLAATGMGDMMFMGQTLTSAMTAWTPKVLSAADAADTLVAAVREGKAEPDEFSRSLGRVIPIASQVGIKFQEVGAAIASMTNIGMSARISTFALRTLLTSFLKPQKPLIEGLKAIGLTADEVVKKMTTKGFLPAMDMIYQKTHGSAKKITQMFTQNAATAFLALFRSADKTKGIFDRMMNSGGDAAKAFKIAMESPAAQFRVAVANLSAAAIVIGAKLLPIFTKIVAWLGRAATWFTNLSSSTQAFVGKMLLAASAAGILLSVLGKLATVSTSLAAMKFMGGTGSGIGIGSKVATGGAVVDTAATAANTAAQSANATARDRNTASAMAQIAAIRAATVALAEEGAVTVSGLVAAQAAALVSGTALEASQESVTIAVAQRAAAQEAANIALGNYTALQAAAIPAITAAEAATAQYTGALGLMGSTYVSTSEAMGAAMTASVAQLRGNALAAQQAAVAATATYGPQSAAALELAAANAALAASEVEVSGAQAASVGAAMADATANQALAAATAEASLASSALANQKMAGIGASFKSMGSGIMSAVGAFGSFIAAHPIGFIITLTAAAVAGTLLIPRLFKHTAASAKEMAGTLEAVTKDTSGKLTDFLDKTLGGHLVVRKGTLEWVPTMQVTLPSVSGVVKWIHTDAVAQRKQIALENEQTRVVAMKAAAQLFLSQAQAAQAAQNAMVSNAGGRRGGGTDPTQTQAYKDLEFMQKVYDDRYKAILKTIEDFGNRKNTIESQFKPLEIKANLTDMKDGVKKAEAELKKLGKGKWSVEVSLREQALINKIAKLKANIKDVTEKNYYILVQMKLEKAQAQVKTLQQVIKRVQADSTIRPEVKSDRLEALNTKLDSAKSNVQKLKVAAKVQVTVNAHSVDTASTKVSRLIRLLNSLPSVKDITIRVNPSGSVTGAGSSSGGYGGRGASTGSLGAAFVENLSTYAGAARNAGIAVGRAGVAGLAIGVEAASPSKRGLYYGLMLAEGFRLGIKKGTAAAVEAAASLAQNVLSIFESAIGINTAIGTLKEQGMPTSKVAKSWATKVASRMKAMILAMQKELRGIDIGAAVKGDKSGFGSKDAGWKADAFGSLISMAEGVGSVFTSFADLTVEKINLALAAMTRAKTKARAFAGAIKALIKALMSEFKNTIVTEFGSGNMTRAMELANSLANVITTFSTITVEAVDAAIVGLRATFNAASLNSLVDLIAGVAHMIRDAFKGTKVDTVVNEAATAAMDLANNLAGVIGTFADLTKEKLDAAIDGLRIVFVATYSTNLIAYIQAIAYMIREAFTGATVDTIVDDATRAAMDLANNTAGIITTFSTITTTTVSNAVDGIANVVAAIPRLKPALLELISKFGAVFAEVSISDTMTKASSAAAQFVSDIAGIISSLAGMTIISAVTDNETGEVVTPLQDIVQAAIYGAQNLVVKAGALKEVLGRMVIALADALGVINLKTLTDIQPVMEALATIAQAISNTISALATITAEQLAAASSGGAALGEGFLAGLISREESIYAAARRIVQTTADILAGNVTGSAILSTPGTGSMVPVYLGPSKGGTKTSVTQQNLSVIIDTVNATSEKQAETAGQTIASTIITTLARAKQSTAR